MKNHNLPLAQDLFTKYMKEAGMVFTPSREEWNDEKWLYRAMKAFICYRGQDPKEGQKYVRSVVSFYTNPPLLKGEGRGLEGYPFFNSKSRIVSWGDTGVIHGLIANCDFSPYPNIEYYYDEFQVNAKACSTSKRGL